MGKLQYVNRKIDGLKLGQVVAKDILKRIPPSSGSRSAARDPQVELDVSHKAITNEAVAIICEALVRSVSHTTQHTKLEELRLRGNVLTASCLRHLASVIKAAAPYIQDVDLGANKISVASRDDAEAWEEFLVSFRECNVLRRLDFSGNPLGAKAFEILARTYAKEQDAAFDFGDGYAEGKTDANILKEGVRKLDLTRNNEEIAPVGTTDHHGQDFVSPKRSMERSTNVSQMVMSHATTSGLHAIPYILLNECEMGDECALHLSYVLERHALVAELIDKVPPARPGEHLRQIEAYDAVDGCNGIIWKPNEGLTEHGNRVLQLAELSRNRGGDDAGDSREEALVESAMVMPRRPSEAPSPFTPISARSRRDSISTVRSTPQSTIQRSLRSDPLRSARSRIQGDILRDRGPSVHDLWQKALEMLSVSRPIILESQYADGFHEANQSPEPSYEAHRPATPRSEDRVSPLIHEANMETDLGMNESLWPRLVPSKSPEIAPVTKPGVFRLSTNKRGQSILQPETQLSVIIPQTRELEITALEDSAPRLALKLPEASYRSRFLKGLDSKIWGRIFAYATDGRELLSAAQQSQVIEYANRRSTLRHEIESLGKPGNVQIWRALEGMGCLAYQ